MSVGDANMTVEGGVPAQDWSPWIGRQQIQSDLIEPSRSQALAAALGRAGVGAPEGELPLLHHWLYFWDVKGPKALGEDGHPRRGGFLPPIPAPRRMWAGGRVSWLHPLPIGEVVKRTSTISKVASKLGRSGALVFVSIRHEVFAGDLLAVDEVQDLVFRGAPDEASATPQPTQAPLEADWREIVTADPVLLFRYSALTMNSHRIHYDRPYATEVEGYAGLVVHGPLQATLLTALAQRRLGAPVRRLVYRGLSPAFDTAALAVCGRPTADGAELWVEQSGRRTFSAEAFTTHLA